MLPKGSYSLKVKTVTRGVKVLNLKNKFKKLSIPITHFSYFMNDMLTSN